MTRPNLFCLLQLVTLAPFTPIQVGTWWLLLVWNLCQHNKQDCREGLQWLSMCPNQILKSGLTIVWQFPVWVSGLRQDAGCTFVYAWWWLCGLLQYQNHCKSMHIMRQAYMAAQASVSTSLLSWKIVMGLWWVARFCKCFLYEGSWMAKSQRKTRINWPPQVCCFAGLWGSLQGLARHLVTKALCS